MSSVYQSRLYGPAVLGSTVTYTLATRPTFGAVGRLIYVSDLNQIQFDTGSEWLVVGTPTALVGSDGTSAALAGEVGEYIERVSVSPVSHTASNTYTDLGGAGNGITLTPGDWDVSAIALWNANGATVSTVELGIGTGSGASFAGLTTGSTSFQGVGPTAASNITITIPTYKLLVPATTTYYGKVVAIYSAGTPQFRGRISARRVR